MSGPACDTARSDMAEFALGLLDGDQRAAMLDHLARCAACRAEAARYSTAVDTVLASSGGEDPPPGFEGRVLAQIGAPAVVSHGLLRRRRRPGWAAVGMAAAAILVVLAAAFAVGLVAGSSSDHDAARARVADMLTSQGRVVGQVTVTGRPAAVLVAAPGWNDAGDHAYELRVTLADGRTIGDGSIELDEGYGGYGLAGVRVDQVRKVEMVAPDGHVACTAVFD